MASVADCAKASFERYYDTVMPLLRSALTAEGGDRQQVAPFPAPQVHKEAGRHAV